jgi:hypothetical protein
MLLQLDSRVVFRDSGCSNLLIHNLHNYQFKKNMVLSKARGACQQQL